MKTTSRILSMVLALVMVFSLSVTAFATGVTPRVDVTVKSSTGATVKSFSITDNVTVGKSVYSVVNGYKAQGAAKWNTVTDYYDPNITHKALETYAGYTTRVLNTSDAADLARVRTEVKKQGYTDADVDGIVWLSGNYAGYGLLKETTSGTTTTYTYVYAGYAWTYSSSIQGEIWDYMCCYNLKANEVISLVYDFNVSVFPRTTPLG